MGNIIARAMRELIMETRNPNTNEDKFTCRVEVVPWEEISNKEICTGKEGVSCPALILLGTTQLPNRVKHGDALHLDSYFDKYLSEFHEPFTDSFLKQVYYDYNIDAHYVAVPLILDTRLVYFK